MNVSWKKKNKYIILKILDKRGVLDVIGDVCLSRKFVLNIVCGFSFKRMWSYSVSSLSHLLCVLYMNLRYHVGIMTVHKVWPLHPFVTWHDEWVFWIIKVNLCGLPGILDQLFELNEIQVLNFEQKYFAGTAALSLSLLLCIIKIIQI